MSHIESAYEKYVVTATITSTICLVISSSLYFYGIAKLYQFRSHLLVQKRFPLLSYAIIVFSFLNGLSQTIIEWYFYITADYSVSRIGHGFSFFVYGLLNVRLCLIYLRWEQNHKQTDATPNHHHHINPYYHWCCITILLFTILGSILLEIGFENHYIQSAICWTTQFVINIIFISIIVCKNVKEGIGCIKETLISLLSTFIVTSMFPLTYISTIASVFFIIIVAVLQYATGIIALYFPLWHIREMEGTLSIHRVSENITIKMDDALLVFIESSEGYKLFSKYLSYCWALENLLFYQKVCIIYHIVFKYKYMNVSDDVDNNYRNKFEFLVSDWEYYQSVIDDNDATRNQLCFEDLKVTLYKFQQEIFEEFIKDGSVNQINISYETQQELALLLENDEKINTFQSFDDFLHLFDSAVMEVFRLLSVMYSYRFKAYVASTQNNDTADTVQNNSDVGV